MGKVSRTALGIGVVVLFAACGGSQTSTGLPGAMPRTFAIATHAERGGSWMLPEATSEDLLYVANDNGTVTVYSYPRGKMVGTLLGFDVPEGECVDKAGDVFITEYDLQQIIEYAHAGKKPIARLDDSGFEPWSCSVDPTTGNLAVVNVRSYTVAIYAHAKGKPKMYPQGIAGSYCGYDNQGNLFVSGFGAGSAPSLEELPKGSGGFESIGFKYNVIGAVQWDDKYLVVGNGERGGMAVYRFTIAGGKATEKGSTSLTGSTTTAFRIQGSTIAALNDHANIGIWKYPGGGYPTKIVYHGVAFPNGVTISPAKYGSSLPSRPRLTAHSHRGRVVE